jgi:hypothetical protein
VKLGLLWLCLNFVVSLWVVECDVFALYGDLLLFLDESCERHCLLIVAFNVECRLSIACANALSTLVHGISEVRINSYIWGDTGLMLVT